MLMPGAGDHRAVAEALRTKAKFHATDAEVIGNDGLLRTIEIRSAPVLDEHGGLLGLRGVSRDVTLQRKTDQEAAELRRQIDLILTATKTNIDIIVRTTPRHVVSTGRPSRIRPDECYEYLREIGTVCGDGPGIRTKR
jgi:hypothetical protein